ncbi:hypothetical protein BYT27DRAFT_7342177 [Phlegmacium glaucopus]|nr:hypothetical protein BYT27DRAFT_7342177 [Phlegmacium glaucopus]
MPSQTQPATVKPKAVSIKKGLEGQDDNLDLLQSYFQELKAVTVEPSLPDVDLLTFAICTHYFGVITIESGTQRDESDEDAEGEPEEDSVDAGYIASPPPPSVSSAASFTSARSANRFGPNDSISEAGISDVHLSDDEKVLKWREAFLAQLQDSDSEEPLLSKGKIPESHNNRSISDRRPSVNVPNPSMGNDIDDYINWPDDVSSDEDAGDLDAQDGQSHMHYHETEVYSQLDEPEYTRVLGREILEPEQFNLPMKGIPEIPTDPNLQAFVYEEASKFQDSLRAQRIQAYQEASASRPLFINPPRSKSTPIGIIYLASSQCVDDPMHRGQLNIGVYVTPDYIEQRGLVSAVKQVVNEAFQDQSCHRVQAIVVDHKAKLHTMELYTSTGFSREGIGRREFFSPVTHEWKDVFYFAILDTDWICENGRGFSPSVRRRPKSLWDDLLICQQREREELLRMEEKTLKRSSSTETIRDKAVAAPIANAWISETSSVASSSMSAATTSSAARNQSPKRRRLGVKPGHTKESSTRRSRAASSSASSIGTVDTMSTISSEWELPARQTFDIPASNGASPPLTPDVKPSTGSIGNWVMLGVSKKGKM